MDTARPLRPGRPPSTRRRRPDAGFTIIEVTMATFVMLFAIASSLIVLQTGFRILDTTRKTTLASQIMQSEMERIRMLSWTNMTDMVAATDAATEAHTTVSLDLDEIFPGNTDTERQLLAYIESTFTATRHASYIADRANQMVQVSIVITWRGIDGVSHSRSSNTQYTKDGLYAYYYRVPTSS